MALLKNRISTIKAPKAWISDRSAKGAEYESQGQARSASPLVTRQPRRFSPERA
jgi:hypothetical protein